MSWPTPQEYNEAVQTPLISFSDFELQNGIVELTPLGIPKAMTGAFASVYRFTTTSGDWAVRCFLNHRPEQKERYEKISKYVLMEKLKYTVDFHYLEEGIKVRGRWYPLLKMNWIDGQTFESFLQSNYRNKETIAFLKEEFARLAKGLDDAGMAHGDLQHGNMIVTQSGDRLNLKLIDYDAIYVPDLAGKLSLEIGHPNYQHPERNEYNYDTTADNFSCWLIYNSLSMIEIDPGLFDKFSGGDECILFRRKDLIHPEESAVFNYLLNHQSEEIKEMTTIIIRMLWTRPELIPELHDKEELDLLPTIKPISKSVHSQEDEFYLETKKEESAINIDNIRSGTRFHQIQRIDWQNLEKESEVVDTSKGFIEKLKTRIENIKDRWLHRFALELWIDKKLSKGEDHLAQGEYEQAIHQFLIAFKGLDLERQDDYSKKLVIRVCLKVCYPFMLLNQNELATNYLLMAYKSSCELRVQVPQARARTAFKLSVSRYRKKDPEGAFKLLESEPNLQASIMEIIKDPIYKDIVHKPETLAMILDSRDYFLQLNKTNEYCYMVQASAILYDLLKNQTAIKLDYKFAQSILFTACVNFQNKNYEDSVIKFRVYLDILDFIKKKKKNIDTEKGEVETGEEENPLTGSTAQALKKEHARALSYFQLVCDLDEMNLARVIKKQSIHLESFDSQALAYLFKLKFSRPAKKKLNVTSLAAWATNNNHHQVREALEYALIANGSLARIVEYIEYLVKNCLFSYNEKFNQKLASSFEPEKLLEIGEKLSSYSYRNFIHEAVLEHANRNQMINHFYYLDGKINSKKSIDFLKEVIETRTQLFVLDVLTTLLEEGFNKLVTTVFPDYADKLLPMSDSGNFNHRMILYTSILQEVSEEEAVQNLLAFHLAMEPRKIRNEYFDLITGSDAEPEFKVFPISFLAISDNEQKELLNFLVNYKRYEALEKLLIYLIHKNKPEKLEEIFDYLYWSTSITRYHKSRYNDVFIDEYFEVVKDVCEQNLYKTDTLKVEDWNRLLDEAIEKKYHLRKKLEAESE